MDLNRSIQETDNTPPTTACSEFQEFQSLSHLAYEFSVLDRSLFPFYALGNSALRSEIYGFSLNTDNCSRLVRGNYVAGYILRDLRIQGRKNTHVYPELCFIFDLPPELVFEIFEHLHPIDLYNLIRTSKGLRSLLLRRQATAVWRETFSRHPNIPTCPPDLSLPKWASLLFGPSTCDDCGFSEAMPDFSFRRRQCDFCMDTNFDYSENFQYFESEHASQEDILLTLVKRTHRFDGMIYPSSPIQHYGTRYSKSEVHSRAAEMKQFMAAIDSNQPNAREAYDTFKTETVRAVDAMMKHVQVCNSWCSNFYYLLDTEFKEKVPRILNRFQKRFVNIGYNPKDVEEAKGDISCWLSEFNIGKCSGKAFRSLLPILETCLKEAKYARLFKEQQELMSQRKNEITAIYEDCQQRLDPAFWQYLPEPSHAYGIHNISLYIYSPEKSEMLVPDDTAQMILLYFDQWLACGKRGLLELMSKHLTPAASQDDALDLATSVFTCTLHSPKFYSVLLGWEDAAVHLECNMTQNHPQPTTDFPEFLFEYSMIGRKTVLFLLGLLGLEASTPALDVEALEARFTCASCPLEAKRGRMKGRFALKFKECVSHAVGLPDHPTDSFLLLSKEATESILFHESSSCPEGELSWCCKHCSWNFESYVSRNSVIHHIQTMHSILEPVQRVDFVYQRQKVPPQRNPYFIGLDIPRTYRCKNCPSHRSPRLWQMRPLLAHLKDRHDVSEPVENVDWYEIHLWKSD